MSSKLSLETENTFIDENNAICSHFSIENVQSNMIVKLERFSGHCHIALSHRWNLNMSFYDCFSQRLFSFSV